MVAIISIAFVNLLGLTVFSLKTTVSAKDRILAQQLSQELLETTRNFRDGTSWSESLGAVTAGVVYHLEKSSGDPPEWQLSSGEEQVGKFTRKVVFEEVRRDSGDNVAESGTLDPDTKKVVATVSWNDKEVELITYLTNWNQ